MIPHTPLRDPTRYPGRGKQLLRLGHQESDANDVVEHQMHAVFDAWEEDDSEKKAGIFVRRVAERAAVEKKLMATMEPVTVTVEDSGSIPLVENTYNLSGDNASGQVGISGYTINSSIADRVGTGGHGPEGLALIYLF